MIEETKVKFSNHVQELQKKISELMQDYDIEMEMTEDVWSRVDHIGSPGGGGITRAFEGNTFENAGVNTSEVFGKINPEFATKLKGSGDELWASGLSLIIHPTNPKIPTIHANFRMIQQGNKLWFGGGADLTPYYPFEEDFKHFHDVWKKACAPYGVYNEMKTVCDKYFTNTHRNNEMRGIGGIFFDHLSSDNIEKDFEMVVDLSNHFIESYFPIVDKRIKEKYTEEDVDFQLHRRGRYVEFNLLHDRGTLFGLKTNGRVDSILISLPRRCKYTYRYGPKAGSVHEKMMEYYYPKSW
jgi:coproporphyrinogen III oxidase